MFLHQLKSPSFPWQTVSILIMLFLISLVMRWISMPDSLFFGFEQGRDALAASKIARLEDFVLVGPKTDIAGVFHGVWYYYLLAVLYGAAQGSPEAVSYAMVFASSLVSVVMFFLVKSLTSERWGLVAGLLTAISFEYISYSRWLSNVTPSVLLMAVSFYCLWQYHQRQKDWWFVAAALAGFGAAQFQIIVTLWFAFALIVLLAAKIIRLPRWKTILITLALVGFLYLPMALFNLRNDFISFRSVIGYMRGETGESHMFNLLSSLTGYGQQLQRLWKKTIVDESLLAHTLVFASTVGGLLIGWWRDRRQKLEQFNAKVFFLLTWLFMPLPVLFFTKSLSLTQVYVGTGLALISLVALSWSYLWRETWGKVVVVLCLGLLCFNATVTTNKLLSNSDVFYLTIQDDYKLRDQKAVLAAIQDDTGDQPYQLQAFTIPYYQPEAWEYLLPHYYPHTPRTGDALVHYVVIEKPVDRHWEEVWISELGPTTLEWEKQYGHFRLQKRTVIEE